MKNKKLVSCNAMGYVLLELHMFQNMFDIAISGKFTCFSPSVDVVVKYIKLFHEQVLYLVLLVLSKFAQIFGILSLEFSHLCICNII